MAFKVPSKRRRDSSGTGSQVSRARSSTPRSVASSPPAVQLQSSRCFAHVPAKNPPALQESRSRAASIAPSETFLNAEDDLAIRDREDNDSLNEVIMALELRNRDTVGCSYYVAKEEKLYLLGDVKSGGLDIVENLKLHIQPTVVLLSSRVDDSIYEAMDPEHFNREHSVQAGENQFRLPYILAIRPSPEFSYEGGKKRLVDIPTLEQGRRLADFVVPGENHLYEEYGEGYETSYTRHQGRLLQLSGWIDLESQISVGCAGAVLTYLQRQRAVHYLPGDENGNRIFRVSAIDMFTLEGTMLLSADTLTSLQIMQSESHPHSHNQGPTKTASGSKEGLSIYGLFHHLAKTPQGKYSLRQYFLRPTLDIEVITERQNSATVFLRPDNDSYTNELMKSLKQIKNMKTAMIHLQKGMSNALTKGGGIRSGVWLTLRSFTYYTLGIRKVFTEILGAEGLAIRTKILENFESHQLANIGRLVTQIVDVKSSAETHRTVVNPGVDNELDEMKRTYDGIENLLNETSKNVASSIPNQFSLDLNVIFFPQIGFLISMPIDPVSGRAEYEGGDEESEQWERIFSTSSRVYYKDYRMQQLDETFGDMHASICADEATDKEIEIIHELATEVLKFETMLCKVSDICGELDCLLALAQGAKLYKLTRPRLSTENIIDIGGGRHLLQELVVPSYVANDTFLVGGRSSVHEETNTGDVCPRSVVTESDIPPSEGPSMILLTGPNYSGKSVYLKQVALIVYMAHVGCFVPADKAVIGLTDKIMTRIATRETVSRIQSAFMIDLQQISSAINQATNRSLLIIDEFGKGTDAADGAGLACGVFEYLLSLGHNRPKVLGATHFHEIFETGFLLKRPELMFGCMEVRLDDDAKQVEDQITYLYNFRPGRSVSSYGTVCAAMNGISHNIVERAEELIMLAARGEDLVTACAAGKAESSTDFEAAEEIARVLLLQDLKIAEDVRGGLEEWLII